MLLLILLLRLSRTWFAFIAATQLAQLSSLPNKILGAFPAELHSRHSVPSLFYRFGYQAAGAGLLVWLSRGHGASSPGGIQNTTGHGHEQCDLTDAALSRG